MSDTREETKTPECWELIPSTLVTTEPPCLFPTTAVAAAAVFATTGGAVVAAAPVAAATGRGILSLSSTHRCTHPSLNTKMDDCEQLMNSVRKHGCVNCLSCMLRKHTYHLQFLLKDIICKKYFECLKYFLERYLKETFYVEDFYTTIHDSLDVIQWDIPYYIAAFLIQTGFHVYEFVLWKALKEKERIALQSLDNALSQCRNQGSYQARDSAKALIKAWVLLEKKNIIPDILKLIISYVDTGFFCIEDDPQYKRDMYEKKLQELRRRGNWYRQNNMSPSGHPVSAGYYSEEDIYDAEFEDQNEEEDL